MKRLIAAFILVADFTLVLACGSAGIESTREIQNSNRADDTGAVPYNGSPAASTAGPATPQANMSESAANMAVANSAQDIRGRKMDMLRGPTDLPDSAAKQPQPTLRPAPDNSFYSVVLTDAAVETRIFKNHPQLNKVEKRSDGKQSSIKVFLKDGRVIELPGEKIEALAAAPASSIIEAAGLVSPAASNGKQTKKKSGDANRS